LLEYEQRLEFLAAQRDRTLTALNPLFLSIR
jgi:hypothetical protein